MGNDTDQFSHRAEAIARRIRDKIGDYDSYQFTESQSGALNIFFDLVQEFDNEEDFLAICVMVPKVIFGLECALHLTTEEMDLETAASSGGADVPPAPGDSTPVPLQPDMHDGHHYFPVRANAAHIDQLPFRPPENVIGCLEIHPSSGLADGDSLFWEKYANRIGFQMHNRIIYGSNKRHLAFIRNLAKDIGHNVIVPNMYFKLFFNRLKRTIDHLGQLPERFDKPSPESRHALLELHQALDEQFDEISRHYEQTSLYLETLLRQSHFEKGHYVLEKKRVHVPSQIIAPQLHQYLPRFEENGIRVTPCPTDAEDDRLTLSVDVGLVAQVFSNLFSNALKYTAPPPAGGDKEVACDAQIDPDGLGPGLPAAAVTVVTTGPPIPSEDSERLFEAGFRVRGNHADGTGHGLFFVRQIVELHGGHAFHEPRPEGNAFTIALPVED